MKSKFKLVTTIALAVAALFFLSPIALAFNAGDPVEIEYGGTWYAGKVKEAKDGQFFISYDNYDSSWDEWVDSARLRAPEATTTEETVSAEESAVTEEATAAEEEGAAVDGEEEAPAEAVDESGIQEITIRKGGSIWATVSPDGTIRVNGSIEGSVEENGNVRVSGMNSGEISSDGTIRKGGMIDGEISSDGTLRANGSIVGGVESDGTIRNNGSIWGDSDNCCPSERSRNAVAAVVVFFAGADFGF